ncbi:lipoprotein [Kozakia baliensis]|nr:lipoprotein [Kozakia baliensis]
MHARFGGLDSRHEAGQSGRKKTKGHKRAAARRFSIGMMGLLTLSACASWRNPPPKDPEALADYKEANDPYEPVNRKMYGIQMWAYHKVLRPVGKAWAWVVPKPIRNSIDNLNQTWNTPIVFFSDVGAGKSRRAGDAFMRYVINMTIGGAGFFDVATSLGYPHHDTDAGMTMATWGVASGPYLFLPGLGPNTFRDAIGYGIDQGLSPINYVPRGYGLLTFNWAYNIAGTLGGFSNSIDAIDHVERDSLDPYAFIRSAWQQNRASQIDTLRNDHRATVPDWYN